MAPWNRTIALALLALCLHTFVPKSARGQTPDSPEVAAGIEAYSLGQFEEASTALNRSLEAGISKRDRAIAFTYLGLIDLAAARDPEAFFRQAVLADPTLELDAQVHAPSRIERFEETRKEVLQVASFDVSVPADTIFVGQEIQAQTRIINSNGEELTGLPVVFSVEGGSEAIRVSDTGSVLGVTPGRTSLRAVIQVLDVTAQAEAVLAVVAPLEGLRVVGPTILAAGSRQTFRVMVGDTGRDPGTAVHWRTSNPRVASVTEGGIVRAFSPGMAEITAEAGGAEATVVVSVVPPLQFPYESLELQVGETYRAGSALSSTHYPEGIDWGSSDPTVASIDPEGSISALAPGSSTIWARAGPFADSLSLEVLGPQKSPMAAFARGILLPGAGEFYAGNKGRGILTLIAAGGALAAGLLSSNVTIVCATPLENGSCPPGSELEEQRTSRVLIGAAAAGGIALVGAIDAARAVSAAKRVGRSVASAFHRN